VDTKTDTALDEIGSSEAQRLKGKIAIANAKLAYQHFKEVIGSASFESEQRRGARPQRPLWASTSTKSPQYSDVLYVDQLIGPDTVNTVTPETLNAFQVHGELRVALESDIDIARRDLETLESLGISLTKITQELEQEGVKKFADSYDQLLAALQEKCYTVARQFAGK
jgi:transaldolase